MNPFFPQRVFGWCLSQQQKRTKQDRQAGLVSVIRRCENTCVLQVGHGKHQWGPRNGLALPGIGG